MSSANYPVTGTSGGGGGLQHNVQAGYQGGPIYNHQGMIGQYCYNEGEWVVQAGGPVAMYPPLQQHSFDHAELNNMHSFYHINNKSYCQSLGGIQPHYLPPNRFNSQRMNNKPSFRPAPLMYDPRFPPPLPGTSQTPFLVSGSWIPKGQGEATPTSDVTHSIATHKTMAHSAQVKGFKALRTQAPVFVPTKTIKNGEYICANSKEEKVCECIEGNDDRVGGDDDDEDLGHKTSVLPDGGWKETDRVVKEMNHELNFSDTTMSGSSSHDSGWLSDASCEGADSGDEVGVSLKETIGKFGQMQTQDSQNLALDDGSDTSGSGNNSTYQECDKSNPSHEEVIHHSGSINQQPILISYPLNSSCVNESERSTPVTVKLLRPSSSVSSQIRTIEQIPTRFMQLLREAAQLAAIQRARVEGLPLICQSSNQLFSHSVHTDPGADVLQTQPPVGQGLLFVDGSGFPGAGPFYELVSSCQYNNQWIAATHGGAYPTEQVGVGQYTPTCLPPPPPVIPSYVPVYESMCCPPDQGYVKVGVGSTTELSPQMCMMQPFQPQFYYNEISGGYQAGSTYSQNTDISMAACHDINSQRQQQSAYTVTVNQILSSEQGKNGNKNEEQGVCNITSVANKDHSSLKTEVYIGNHKEVGVGGDNWSGSQYGGCAVPTYVVHLDESSRPCAVYENDGHHKTYRQQSVVLPNGMMYQAQAMPFTPRATSTQAAYTYCN